MRVRLLKKQSGADEQKKRRQKERIEKGQLFRSGGEISGLLTLAGGRGHRQGWLCWNHMKN